MGRRLADGRRWWVLVLLLLLAMAAAGPLLFNAGFLNTRGGGDSPFLLFRLHQLASALSDGHFPVRWMPDAAYGLGYPFFNYYAALPYYAGAALHFWGLGLVAAVKLTQWLGFLLAAWAMWGLVRTLTRGNRWAPWLSAVAYTFAPYHLVNVYVRGDSLSEFWAMGLYPLILWAAIRLWTQPGRGRLVLFALSYAALILTHNISALIFSPFLALFLLLLILRRGAQSWRWLALGLVLGLALSAFYALPALGEQDAVQLTAQTSGYFHYGVHFRDLALGHQGRDLVQTSLLFDYEITGPTPFGMGLVQAILAAAGLIAALLRLRRGDRQADQGIPGAVAAFAVVTFLIATLMITPASRFLWDHLPLLPLVQFPWRFLSVQALAAALLVAWLAPAPPSSGGSRARLLRHATPSILAFVIAVAALGDLHPDIIALTSADVTPERLQLYEWFSGNVGTTIRYEYLPRAVVPRLYTSEKLITGRPMEASVIEGTGTAARLEKRTGRERWQVEVQSESATLAFPTLYWPGWYARVDGERLPLRPAPSLGTMVLDLPAGQHDVILVLGRTPLRLGAELISLAALLLSLALLLPLAPGITQAPRLVLLYGLPLLLAGIILHLVPTPSLPASDLTWDFAQQAFLHHNPDGVPFGDAAVMQDYQITQRADGGWQVAVRWTQVSRPGLAAVLSLAHPAQVLQDSPYPLTADRQPLTVGQDQTVFYLPSPAGVPPGPLLPQLELLEADGVIPALTSAGRKRGDLFLHPIPAAPPSPGPTIQENVQLLSAEVSPLTPERLGVTLRWAVGEPVDANWKVALRLRDPAGDEWAALDTQPGYGFYPTGAWQPGTAFSEQLVLAVPYGLAPGEYHLSVSLYDATSLLPGWGPQERIVTLPTAAPYDGRPLLHRFSPLLAVASLTAPDAISQGDSLPFTVGWVALDEMDDPVQIRWDLVAPDETLAASSTGALQIGSGTLVLDRQTLATDPHVHPGSYLLRLTVPGAVPWEARTITVQERTRRFDLPEMDSVLAAQFGGLIRLEGADLAQSQDVLEMTLYWRALSAVPADYIVFVHLFDPATEQILTQHDAMPQNYNYPTSRWAAGEVVEDPITLSLSEVPAGRYQLGVGLYWKEGDQYPRLPAVAANGEPVPGDRVVLPTELTVP